MCAQGWILAKGMLRLSADMTELAVPAALSTVLRGAAAGAFAPAAFGASIGASAALGAALAGVGALSAVLAVLQSPLGLSPGAALSRFDFPGGLTQSAYSVSSGALCMVSVVLLAVSVSLHSRRTRGGVLLGLLAAGGVTAAHATLCALTPYCYH